MRIAYDYGEAHVPTAYAGRIVLTFDNERAVVDLSDKKVTRNDATFRIHASNMYVRWGAPRRAKRDANEVRHRTGLMCALPAGGREHRGEP